MTRLRLPAHVAAIGAAVLLAACGGGTDRASAPSGATASTGQVSPPATATQVSFHAASRFAEQVSFGATPALVAELQAKGFERWIDEQFARPLAVYDTAAVAESAPGSVPEKNAYVRVRFGELALSGDDPLRQRVVWSLHNFIVARGTNTGMVVWANLLSQHAFGRYGELLRAITLDPTMGDYLDNVENRPKSASCSTCAPNENYARELMQLFSLGLLNLGDDGRPLLDGRGRVQETYTQADVMELARALTGWQYDFRGNGSEWFEQKYTRPLIPSAIASERDSGAKRVLGRSFPAGQTARQDVDDVVALLMAHPNIAPFVTLRLIQHLVKSDPSPAYMRRVVARFRDNGQGVAGDMKAVLKAILLDEEARRGDAPGAPDAGAGKYREPFLWTTAWLRALGCQRWPTLRQFEPGLDPYWMNNQTPFNQSSVFGFYQGTDRAPGSTLLAPEQKLVSAGELHRRLYQLDDFIDMRPGLKTAVFDRAGCDLTTLRQVWAASPTAYVDWISRSFFRGAMSPAVRRLMLDKRALVGSGADPDIEALRLIGFALSMPDFAVMR